MSHLTALNPAQREAVTSLEGPLLVLAGAGSGKTRVITHRIIHLIETGTAPQNILAVTFTNKAAKEMRERVINLLSKQKMVGEGLPTITTFHALGANLLREYRGRWGPVQQFIIFDRSDSRGAIKKALALAGYDSKQFEPRRILALISRGKGEALTRLAYQDSATNYLEQVVAKTWTHYEQILKANHALDFDDLLTQTLFMLKSKPEIRAELKRRFSYIHVDEYQDTNKVQYEIVLALASQAQNVCVVGDIDQNIYSWRGANIKNVLQFEKHFAGAKTILLEENYRSTKTIIGVSNEVITKNNNRVEKTVFTNNQAGELISLYAAEDEQAEAEYVALKAKQLIAAGKPPGAIAVLFRTNFQSRVMERVFLDFGVPYQLLGTRFFGRKEVKDILSYLRLAQNETGIADLARIINTPARGIGKVTALKVIMGQENELKGAALKKVAAFNELMAEIKQATKTKKMSAVIKLIIELSGYKAYLKQQGEEGLEKLENLYELVTSATRYDNLAPAEAAAEFLGEVALQSDQDELKNKAESDAVRLMTVHAAKGLEFPYVFVSGLEEGLFPHEKLDSDGLIDHEEERRLFYVALTRAEKKVYLTYARGRTIFGSKRINLPSSFLSDISESYLKMEALGETETETIIEIK